MAALTARRQAPRCPDVTCFGYLGSLTPNWRNKGPRRRKMRLLRSDGSAGAGKTTGPALLKIPLPDDIHVMPDVPRNEIADRERVLGAAVGQPDKAKLIVRQGIKQIFCRLPDRFELGDELFPAP